MAKFVIIFQSKERVPVCFTSVIRLICLRSSSELLISRKSRKLFTGYLKTLNLYYWCWPKGSGKWKCKKFKNDNKNTKVFRTFVNPNKHFKITFHSHYSLNLWLTRHYSPCMPMIFILVILFLKNIFMFVGKYPPKVMSVHCKL